MTKDVQPEGYKTFKEENFENKDIFYSIGILNKFKDEEISDIHSDLVELLNNFEKLREEMEIDSKLEILLKKRNYTHSEIHPIAQYGISAGLMPNASSNQSPRLTYQASMGKQASGQYHTMHHDRMTDPTVKVLQKPTRSLWESEIAEPAGFNIMPSGATVNVAIISEYSYLY